MGAYIIASDGTVSDVEILFASDGDTGAIAQRTVADGERLEFFLVQDGAGIVDTLAFNTSGAAPIADGVEIFYSDTPSLNSDGEQHFLSGANGNGGLRVGVEDLVGLADADYQDLVFTVDALSADPLTIV